jgi:transcriptional regulator with XRE-family HTH domain
MTKTTTPPPAVHYAALVGKVLQSTRQQQQLGQKPFSDALGLTQSAYSKIENGQTTISVSQLRIVARQLHVKPNEIIEKAEQWATNLKAQGVNVLDTTPENPAALLVGLGILAALVAMASSSK